MKKLLAAVALAGTLAACNSYDPGSRAAAGGLVGAGAGAVVGGLASGTTGGALAGAAIGGVGGAAVGAATTPGPRYGYGRGYGRSCVAVDDFGQRVYVPC